MHTTRAPRSIYECHHQPGVAALVPRALPLANNPSRLTACNRYDVTSQDEDARNLLRHDIKDATSQ